MRGVLMKYEQPTFSLPVAKGNMTQEAYEVAVGLRCPFCTSPDKDTHYMSDAPYPQSESPCLHPWHKQ
jgi:hypothetical protein